MHDGVEYPLDVLIYATGFQWMATSTFNMITGRDGRTLKQKWESEGTKTFLGLHSHGFPNLFIVSGPQGGGGSFNFTDAIDTHSDYVVWVLQTMRERGAGIIDVRAEPEAAYAEHCRQADIASAPLRDCLSYYNGHGDAEPGSLAYYGGGRWHRLRIEERSRRAGSPTCSRRCRAAPTPIHQKCHPGQAAQRRRSGTYFAPSATSRSRMSPLRGSPG